jgi:hypothetical protein
MIKYIHVILEINKILFYLHLYFISQSAPDIKKKTSKNYGPEIPRAKILNNREKEQKAQKFKRDQT